MISTEVALIMTAGGIGGAILVSQMALRNWFKREKFKFNQQADRKEMNLRFKKLEKEFKLKEAPPIPPRKEGVVESIQGINPEIIQTIAGLLSKNEDDDYIDVEPEKKPDILETILEVAQKNPDLASKFIEGITKKATGEKKVDEWKSQE